MGTGETSQKDTADGTFKNLMDLKDCIKDSPNFRQQLRHRELEISDLESKLEKVVSMCDKMVAAGNTYTDTCRSFSVSIKELASHFTKEEVVAATLKKFYEALSELQSFYSVLFDQTQKSVQTCLRNYLSSGLRKAKETKKSFHRVSDELANAINRNGHIPKSKIAEAEEASAHLVTMENQFSHSAVDYAYHINLITCNKSHEIMQSLVAYMRSQTTFFHEGYDLLRQFDPFMTMVESKVDVLVKNSQTVTQEMELRHTYVSPKRLEDSSQEDPYASPIENPSVPIEMSGYLFKKPRGNNPFKSWSRRWFIVKTSKLVYQSESKEEDHVTVAEDLRICSVKKAEDQERRFCFEVVTPTRSCMLQADSEVLRRKWLSYLEAGIARALNVSASNKKTEEMEEFRKRSMVVSKGTPIHVLNQSPTAGRKNDGSGEYSLGIAFLDVPGNSACADCGNFKPTWASINLGVTLCIECSGIHRGLGVHISKVRSITLDDWEPELQKVMCALGNARVNGIYEYEIPSHVKKPTSESSRSARETFIRLKYIQHAFVHPHPDFIRPEAPLPPISIPELLAPSGSRGSIGSSPKSPQKRSFSPALKLRPRLLKHNVPRPSSASSTVTNESTPTGSEEDLRRPDHGQAVETPTGLHALAENFRKMEEKRKNSGSISSSGSGSSQLRPAAWGSSLGDKLKSARRSSKKISNYAMNKLGEGQESIMKRLKKTGRDRASREILRETLSDTDEDPPKVNSSLLYSFSASTHNLSSKAGGNNSNHGAAAGGKNVGENSTPPPKPPRTFKLKSLRDLNADEGNDDSDGAIETAVDLLEHQDSFSSEILSAVQNVSGFPNSLDEAALANGRLPSTSSSSSFGSIIMRSESSPQLCHVSNLIRSESSHSNFLSESPRLQTISEDGLDGARTNDERENPRVSISANLSPLPHSSPVILPENRLYNSVPLRRKNQVDKKGPAAEVCRDDSTVFLSLVSSGSSAGVVQSQEGLSVPKFESTPEPPVDSMLDNRMSIISVTSAEYFSAESLNGGSKNNSVSSSPEDFESGKGMMIPVSPIPPIAEANGMSRRSVGEPSSRESSDKSDRQIPGGMEGVRLNSSLSLDDDSFNTPPSSPCLSATPSPHPPSDSSSLLEVYNAADEYHRSSTATLKAGLKFSEEERAAMSASILRDSSAAETAGEKTASSLAGPEASSSWTESSSMKEVKLADAGSDLDSKKEESKPKENGTACSQEVKVNNSSEKQAEEECDGTVTVSVMERSEAGSRSEDADSVFGIGGEDAPPTPTAVTKSPVPVAPKRIKRRRSSTMSNTSSETLPTRGSKNKWKQKADKSDGAVSKDDNFNTEHGLHLDSMVSAFSEKDYEDIFSKVFIKKHNHGTPENKGTAENNSQEVGEVVLSPEGKVCKFEMEGRTEESEVCPEGSGEDGGTAGEDVEDWTVVIPDSVHPNLFLYSSVSSANLPGILCALAHGANPNYANEDEDSRTPILHAIKMGNKAIVEYLYQNGSKLTSIDKSGKGCLHYAAVLDNAGLVMVLLKRGVDPAIKDADGCDPIAYALGQEQSNGDILTMLRMATFREETKSGDNKQSEYQEQEGEFFKDVEVASLVDSGRSNNRMSTPSIEGSISLDSK